MIEIGLTQGKVAIVDDVDSDLNKITWHTNRNTYRVCYAERTVKGKCVVMHRVVMERVLSRRLTRFDSVDHINCDGLDNRRSNLRLANRSQQQANTPKQRTTKGKPTYSKYKGVSWYKHIQKWAARIQVDLRDVHLGVFESEEDAARAYDKAAKESFGEFAKLNFPDYLVTASGI